MNLSDFLLIIGLYLSIIGTWRLANSTKPSPIGAEPSIYQREEEKYYPIKDLFMLGKIIKWLFNFRSRVGISTAVILKKKFSWGLRWLILGILLTGISQFVR